MSKQSDEYEQFVQNVIQEKLGSGVNVAWRRSVTGKRSGRTITVDVSFTSRFAEGIDVLFVVECKCYSHSVSVDDVEEFITKLDDIGAHKGVMVTTVGFQEGAVQTAKGYGVALALLTKTRQKGELTFVVNSKGQIDAPAPEGFWQGNLRGSSDTYDGGIRFESMSQFVSFLVAAQWTEWSRRTFKTPTTVDGSVT